MARRKKRRGSRKRKIPLAATAGFVAAILPVLDPIIKGDFAGAARFLAEGFTTPAGLQRTLLPILLGAGVSMLAAKSGINRYLQVPMVKI